MKSLSSRLLKSLLVGPLFIVSGQGGQDESTITVKVTGKVADKGELKIQYLDGFRSAVAGQVIAYHSSHPDSMKALIVRANREARSISWETDAPPENAPGGHYYFMWLAGLESGGLSQSKVSHKFDMMVNGEHWFTFRNLKDSTSTNWTLAGGNGTELSFKATLVDRVGDLFGNMVLKVPKTLLRPGRRVVIEVIGEDAGSPEWYMAFQYSFKSTPTLRLEPALLRERDTLVQMVRLSLDNLENGRSVEITTPHQGAINKPLEIGPNIFFLPILAVESEEVMPVEFKVDGKLVEKSLLRVKPVARREIYLLSYSHNDIGYTDLQPNIEKKQWSNLDEALRLIKKTQDYPAEARYKWNMEVLWSLESYLEHATEEKRSEVMSAIRDGSIGLNALYANILTGLANSVEMGHFTDYARRLTANYGLKITSAVVSDIPGFTWGIVPALAEVGVKYFAPSPNPFDRIGYTLENWGDKPFYWVSQSSEERILVWVAGASYASFHEGDLTSLGDEKLLRLMRKLDETNYPYEIVHLPYTVGGDNGPPDSNLSDFVKRWNERYVAPRLTIATHDQMFREFEKRYGSTLPSFIGDFTPYWEDGAASSAFETALNRQAADKLIQGEALWSMISPESYPENEYYSAWRNVILYDEHTWGAHNSISEPDIPFVKGQWKIKRQFALDAESLSLSLIDKALKSPGPTKRGETAIDIYNTNSWPRSDVVILSEAQSSAGDLIVDERGDSVPSQRLSSGELAVFAEDVSPMSSERFFVRKGKAYNRGDAKAFGNVLENGLIGLSVDERTGAVQSLKWKKNDVEFVDAGKGFGMNQYLYVLGKNPKDAQKVRNVKIRVKEKGNLLASLAVEAEAPGCERYSYEARLYRGLSRVDIINEIDKRAVRDKEGVHIGFPFNVSNGQVRYDVANGIVRPEEDQLPGSCKNFFSVQNWVDVSNDEYGITWATVDAPLIEIGSITAEQPWMRSIEPTQLIYSYIMNNYWHTNYKADQEGPVVFRYSLFPHADFKAEEAVRFGRERREPLMAVVADASKKATSSLFSVEPTGVQVSSVKPIGGGRSWLLYLYNPTSKNQKTTLKWREGDAVKMHLSDAFGDLGVEIGNDFPVPAFGSSHVRVDRIK